MGPEKELWKTIYGHAPYEVSTIGRVRNGARILSPRLYGVGYFGVRLHGKEHYIHRLVARAFLGPIPPGWQVHHKNGNQAGNRLENLEIVTPWENSQHYWHPEWYASQYRIPGFQTLEGVP